MICKFCNEKMTLSVKNANADIFDIHVCRNCVSNYQTLHKTLSYRVDGLLLWEIFQIDEYHVLYSHNSILTATSDGFTDIFKDAIGVLDQDNDAAPMTLNNKVCRLDSIVRLPFDDLEVCKKRLTILTTFS